MRNAAANFDDDFGYDEPRRPAPRKPRAASGKSKSRKKKGNRFGVDMLKVARYTALGTSAAIVLGIVVNALVMQKGHHPAPLFGKAITLSDVGPVEKHTSPASTQTARDGADASAALPEQPASPAVLPVVVPMPVAKPRHASQVVADKAAGDDGIARLLRGEAPAQTVGDKNIGDKSEPKTVLGAQKALAKLGYALKPNGTLGPATRKAIEAFEKQRNLPVKGDLSRRVVKMLTAETGVTID